MTGIEIALVSVPLIIALVYAGVYVPIALCLVSFVGVALIRSDFRIASDLLWLSAHRSIGEYTFVTIPLFVLMGMLVNVSGLATDAYDVANRLFRRLSGGLAIATVFANAIFAAVTGVSVASAAVFSKIAVPEMLRFGYSPKLASGVVAGSSILGMLLPPSVLLIVFAILTEQSVGKLFLAAILPGVMLAVLFSVGIWLAATFFPSLAPGVKDETKDEGNLALYAIRKIWPIVTLMIAVIGGIYAGAFTATESAAVGSVGALLIALIRRRLTVRAFWESLRETARVSASILFLVISATIYARMLTLSGLPMQIADLVDAMNMGVVQMIIFYVILIVLLGTVIDTISVVLIVVPIFLPVMIAAGIDPIWMGIVTIIAAEIGLLTPPVGLSVFVIKASLQEHDISLSDIFWGAAPFALVMLLLIVILTIFPQLVTVMG